MFQGYLNRVSFIITAIISIIVLITFVQTQYFNFFYNYLIIIINVLLSFNNDNRLSTYPLLILIFINDKHNSNNLLDFHFADDSTGLCKGKHVNETVPFLNYDLQKNWSLVTFP